MSHKKREGPPKLKLSKPFTVKTEQAPRADAIPSFSMEAYWIGYGYLGRGVFRLRNPPSYTRRRFLFARDHKGRIRYFNWTEPNRGEEVIRVINFRKLKKITRKEAKKHFRKII